MDFKNVQRNEKPLLSRTEITGEIVFSGVTPSNDTLKKKLAEVLKASEELVVVRKIATYYGDEKATFLAYVYKTKEDMLKIEPKEKKGKKEKKEAAKKEEAKK